MTTQVRTLELLSPARNAAIAIEAVRHGADAVYIGAPAFGARAAAGNSVADIATAVEFAHRFNARIYCTMNTILFDSELSAAEDMVWQLYRAGVDALIVQDMAYLGMHLPPIALHASTQCDIRTPEKAVWLASAGFSQLVLPREMSLEEISAVHAAVPGVPLEVFVHGALCVSYSGDCQAGFMAMGRSANRGECPQMCRLPYDLLDGDGKVVRKNGHFLSLRDLNRLEGLDDLVEAGVSSFKIEGRLKDAAYVKNVVAAYSRQLDRIVARSEGSLRRSSCGVVDLGFEPSLDRTFNRGYTSYFISGTRGPSKLKMATVDSPKWTGQPVGKVEGAFDPRKGCFRASLSADLANGDGLGFFDSSRRFVGFRLNRVEGGSLYPASRVDPRPGDTLYRNHDKAFMESLSSDSRPSARRLIPVRMVLRASPRARLGLEAEDVRGNRVEVFADCPLSEARTPQTEQRRRNIAKLGATDYVLENYEDALGDGVFVPASVLAGLRRDCIGALDKAQQTCYHFDRRKPSAIASDAFAGMAPLTYHDNVANRLARTFYEEHGATVGQTAVETSPSRAADPGMTVMTTRYCLRRELGACLRDQSAKDRLKGPLKLRSLDGTTYRLDFDCSRCGMKVLL